MLAIDKLAFPLAVGGRVGPDIVEERVTAPDAAVMQHHDTGIAPVDAVEHANVDRIEPVADTIGTDRTGRRRVEVVDRGQNGPEPDTRQGGAATLEVNFLSTGRARETQDGVVDVKHRNIIGIVIVTRHPDLGREDAVSRGETAIERRAGIAAIKSATFRGEHHAAPRPALGHETEFV